MDADVFAWLSKSEKFGMTVVEAVASMYPVVISEKVNIWLENKKVWTGLWDWIVVKIDPR